MAKNDKVLLDGIIDDRVDKKLPSSDRGEAFEYFAIEQMLKDLDLSRDEILNCIVDGSDDGGIDGFFILVNGNLLADTELFNWPKSGAVLEVWIITCKHHDTFKQAPLDKLVASLHELFDLGLPNDKLKGNYSDIIFTCRDNLKYAYKKLSTKMSTFTLNFSYASRGDTSDIGAAVKARSEQILSVARESFNGCDTSFIFYGSSELIGLFRKTPAYALDLPFHDVLTSGERYVVLTGLNDYFNFITDNGKLRRYLFDSNVRDFMGANRVNEDIRATLEDKDSPDFWWLNNGVTILATSAHVIGKSIRLNDIQIVNGLQTTESIFRYFAEGAIDADARSILVKIIVSKDDSVRDAIIRATNNQTDVGLTSLHATDKIQRDIEEILLRNGIYYERRQNYYQNLGHSASAIITPLYLASGYVNLILKSPSKATMLKSKFMSSNAKYNLVFSEETPIEVWPIIATILKKTDIALESLRPTHKIPTERYLKRSRQITCFLTLAKLMNKFDFNTKELAAFNIEHFTEQSIIDTIRFIKDEYPNFMLYNNLIGTIQTKKICTAYAKLLSLPGIEMVETINNINFSEKTIEYEVDLEFALKINDILPEQPWKPGLETIITKQLNCTHKNYFDAVSILINKGIRNRQKDGVVYDKEGNVLSFDPERVDPETMELKQTTLR